MGRYLLLWELDRSSARVDPKERGAGFKMLIDLVKNDVEKGLTKDWGVFVGEHCGYSVVEGTEIDIMNLIQQYTPYVYFKVHPIGTIAQVEQMIKTLMK